MSSIDYILIRFPLIGRGQHLLRKFHERKLELLLKYKITKPIILYWFKFLCCYRVFCELLGEKLGKSYLNPLTLFIFLVSSRVHMTGYVIMIALVIYKFDMSFLRMQNFYRNNRTELLHQHFNRQHIRGMKSFVEIIVEAAKNPIVQSVTLGVGGALTWKGLDVHDTNKNQVISKEDRDAENLRHKENQSLEAEKSRQAEALAVEKSRQAESP